MGRDRLPLKNPICLSLDISDRSVGLSLLRTAGARAGMVKAGPVPFLSFGEQLLKEAEQLAVPIFLDLKWHDIPHTVSETIKRLPSVAIRMITIHALGGPTMIEAARKACDTLGANRPVLVAVTALTHLTDTELQRIGLPERTTAVKRLGELALSSGADGLVLSPNELPLARNAWGSAPILVTPGIRPLGMMIGGDDQANASTPQEALRNGSDLLVVGRPVLMAEDPASAMESLLRESGPLWGANPIR